MPKLTIDERFIDLPIVAYLGGRSHLFWSPLNEIHRALMRLAVYLLLLLVIPTVPIIPGVRTLVMSNVAPNAYLFTDNFNRSEIGPNWTVIQQGGTGWEIQNGQLCHPDVGSILPRIRVTYLNLSEFLMETDLQPGYVRQFDELGLAFRVRDTGNMYMGIIYAGNSNTTFDSVFFQKMINGTKYWSPLHVITPIPIGRVRFGIEVTNVGSDMNVDFQVNGQSVWNYSYYQGWGRTPEFTVGYVGIYMGGWMPACYGNFDVAMPHSSSASPLTVDFQPVPISPTVNANVEFAATVSGGTPPYSCTWGFGDGSTRLGCSSSYAFTQTGSFNVTLTVQDSSSPRLITGQSHLVLVQAAPLHVAFAFRPTSPTIDSQVSFVATLSGGTAPYNCTWDFGDDREGTGCTVTHSFAVAGSFTVAIIATDHSQPPQSQELRQTVTVSQAPPSNPPGPPAQSQSFTWFLFLLFISFFFGIATLTVAAFYRSKTRWVAKGSTILSL